MKRTCARLLLTLVLLSGHAAFGQGQGTSKEAIDIEVRAVRGSSPASSGRLCVGARNAIRVELALRGPTPAKSVGLRLVMLLPDGDPAGVLVAEGSVAFAPGARTASFTFLNVDVPSRLRGRGALLEVRANHQRGVVEQELGNNSRAIALDSAADWSCSSD